jgi:hypothetical protein
MWLLKYDMQLMRNISMNFDVVLMAHLLHDSLLIIIAK